MGLFDNIFGGQSNQPKKDTDYLQANILAKLGEENVGSGDFKKAISYIHEFFEIMQRNSFPDLQHLIQPCYFNLALSYSNSSDYQNAVTYWTKFIQSDKTNFDAYFERTMSYFELNKLPEALYDIECALKLKPNRADLYVNKGIAYIKMGNKIEARKALTKAVEMGNRDAQQYIDKHC